MSHRVVSCKSNFTRISNPCIAGFLVRILMFPLVASLSFVFSTHAVASPPASNTTGKNIEVRQAFDQATVGKAAHFVKILPGEYEIGDALRGSYEGLHKVEISKAYEIQAAHVTQLQWYLVMKGSLEKNRFGKAISVSPSEFILKEHCDAGSVPEPEENLPELCKHHPVEGVSWEDVHVFMNRLNRFQTKFTYRLPTNAEWEIAARAGLPAEYPYGFGAEFDGKYAWFSGNSGERTHAVATREGTPSPSNPEDLLYDMAGNVYQWVEDTFGDYNKMNPTDPVSCPSASFIKATGNAGECPLPEDYRVLRGGGFYSTPEALLSSNRTSDIQTGVSGNSNGFRLVRAPRSQIGLVRNSSPQKARGQ